jgi:hypothetical protein
MNAHHNESPSGTKRREISLDLDKLPDLYPDRREIPPRAQPPHRRPAPACGKNGMEPMTGRERLDGRRRRTDGKAAAG